jgi:two-component system LytT family sensor kinase
MNIINKAHMNTKDLNKVEFWIASLLYGYSILSLITTGSAEDNVIPHQFEDAGIGFNYTSNFFLPELFRYSILYFSFLLLNFCCLPPLYKKINTGLNVVLTLLVFIFSGFVISIAQTYSKAYLLVEYDDIDRAYNKIFFSGFSYAAWLVLLIGIYVGLKKLIIYLVEHDENDQHNRMKLEISFGAAFWFVGVLLWIAGGADFEVILGWTLVVFAAIFLLFFALYYQIPLTLEQQKPYRSYYGKLTIITLILTLPICLIAALLSRNDAIAPIVMVIHVGTQLLIIAPLAWYIYKKRGETADQIFWLKKELRKSDASLGFLKSQINPHFLFNALNTLYGTALQENAERTGEGIQTLGDMMRFMLQENMQDKISLTRDIEYLNNYIALQKLRTSTSVDIVINTEIEEAFTASNISPMLLIPFVENAFKHGISLQSPSHIKITLQTKDNTLYFDVHNSIHLKADGDPEKLVSGIGLENVKQRLNLLYPKKHELIIRESAKEFFVHLTLNLD